MAVNLTSASPVITAKPMGVYHRLLWGIILLVSCLVTPISIASAEPIERSFLLNLDGGQSFENLLDQAQDLAKISIDEEFAYNPQATEISIIVSGEHQGQIVPLLRSKVSRSQWQSDSRIYRWTRYFVTSSGMLLGFYDSPATPTPQTPFIGAPRRSNFQNDPGFRDD
ncbi:MAG: hypothetical protein AB1589_16875 [Cyanobacteriota bacterium]